MTDKAKSEAKTEARAKSKPRKPKASRPPTLEERQAAMAKAAAAADRLEAEPGVVIGLDYNEWSPRVVPLDLPEGAVKAHIAHAESQGYVHAPELHVAGVHSCWIGIMPADVYKQTIFAAKKRQNDDAKRRMQIRDSVARL